MSEKHHLVVYGHKVPRWLHRVAARYRRAPHPAVKPGLRRRGWRR